MQSMLRKTIPASGFIAQSIIQEHCASLCILYIYQEQFKNKTKNTESRPKQQRKGQQRPPGGGRNKGFLLFSTKKRGRKKEKVGEEIRNFGQNIYPRVSSMSLKGSVIFFARVPTWGIFPKDEFYVSHSYSLENLMDYFSNPLYLLSY